MISECITLAQKQYKNRHEWVGKVIHGELCKKLKFHQTNKWNLSLKMKRVKFFKTLQYKQTNKYLLEDQTKF